MCWDLFFVLPSWRISIDRRTASSSEVASRSSLQSLGASRVVLRVGVERYEGQFVNIRRADPDRRRVFNSCASTTSSVLLSVYVVVVIRTVDMKCYSRLY